MSTERQQQPRGHEAVDTPRFAAFGARNFRRYFIGQIISSVGSWTQALAVTWLVLDLTDRSDQLGIVMALQFLPMLLLGAPAGVLADKIDNRRLLIATSTASGLVALGFGAMIASGHTSMWAIYMLTTMLGLLLAVERPAMQAILFQLVGPDLLPSAVAANSTINSMSRLVGPALAGALIAGFGVGICFAVNAASYLVVIGALAGLRRSELIDRPLLGRTKGKLREGFAYVRNQPDVRRPLVVMAVVGTMALNFQTTFPSMVRFEFDLGAGSIGTAMSVSAIGSILGGIYIAGVQARLTPHARHRAGRIRGDSHHARTRPGILGIRRTQHPVGVRIRIVPIRRHRGAAAGHRAGDAGSGHGAATDGVVRQHPDRSTPHGMDHPDLIGTNPVRPRRTLRPRMRGGGTAPAPRRPTR